MEQINIPGRSPGFRRPESLISMEGEVIPDIEYLIDGSDYEFLESLNGKYGGSPSKKSKKKKGKSSSNSGDGVLSVDQFEVIMTKLERSVWDLQEEGHSHERAAADGEDQELPFKLNDTQCGVCFQRRRSRKNYVVECDMCHCVAHMSCCVMYTVEKRKRWRCQACVDGKGYGKLAVPASVQKQVELTCAMCPFGQEAGVMMRTHDKKQWVHARCAIWLGAVLLGRKTVLKTAKVPDGYANQRHEGVCFGCKRKNSGALLKCDHEGCTLKFHVACACKKNCFLNMDNIYHVNRNLTNAGSLNSSMSGGGVLLPEDQPSVPAKRGPKPGYNSYKKLNIISVNCSQFCPSHSPKVRVASLDSESIWMRVRDTIPTLLPEGYEAEIATALYEHWVDRRLENGKWGELPLLRSLEAKRYALRREQRLRKKEQKKLSLPAGGLLHIPTDPVYNQMLQLRVEMDKARTIIDLLARRERFKKQIVQHDADEFALEQWNAPAPVNLDEACARIAAATADATPAPASRNDTYGSVSTVPFTLDDAQEPDAGEQEEMIDVAELSTDKDAEGTPISRPPPPKPPAMVLSVSYGKPPTRDDIPTFRARRRGPPRPPTVGNGLALVWPDDAPKPKRKRGRPPRNALNPTGPPPATARLPPAFIQARYGDDALLAELEMEMESPMDDDDDPEWMRKPYTYKKKKHSKLKRKAMQGFL